MAPYSILFRLSQFAFVFPTGENPIRFVYLEELFGVGLVALHKDALLTGPAGVEAQDLA